MTVPSITFSSYDLFPSPTTDSASLSQFQEPAFAVIHTHFPPHSSSPTPPPPRLQRFFSPARTGLSLGLPTFHSYFPLPVFIFFLMWLGIHGLLLSVFWSQSLNYPLDVCAYAVTLVFHQDFKGPYGAVHSYRSIIDYIAYAIIYIPWLFCNYRFLFLNPSTIFTQIPSLLSLW